MAIDDLIAAIDEGDGEALTTLLADNDPNALGEDGKAPIHKAAEGEPSCLEVLIAHAGIDLNLKDSEGSTALMAAAAYGDVDCVQKLVDAGCDQTATNDAGQTAVAIAEADGNNDVITILGGTAVEETKPEPELGLKPRRNSVSSESVDPNAKLDVSQLPQTEKSPEDSARIKAIIEGNFLFKSLDAKTLQVCINSMSEVSFAEGDLVIKQGDEGDYFYVVGAPCPRPPAAAPAPLLPSCLCTSSVLRSRPVISCCSRRTSPALPRRQRAVRSTAMCKRTRASGSCRRRWQTRRETRGPR